MSAGESAAHLELKRLALSWAQLHGYRIAAAEITLPNLRFRLDVAGYQPQRTRSSLPTARAGKERLVWQQCVGVTAVFECKASRPDFRRDASSIATITERLRVLHERKERAENELRLFCPSICNGDSLFQEYHSVDFERPGYDRYARTLAEIRRLTSQLHANTKLDRLVKWSAANLFYVVAEPDAVRAHELPACWGLLVRENSGLRLVTRPLLQEISEPQRLSLLHRIALTATRAVNREHGVTFEMPGC